jgi:CDP-diacylglycerol--serine O-phosphatidyltransferase
MDSRVLTYRLLTPANLVTFCSLACGLLLVDQAVGGRLEYLGLLFTACLICDGLDGFVARKMRTSSEFGAEVDSLTDAIAFSFVPMIVAGSYVGFPADALFYCLRVLYVVCAVIRLAKFNLQENKSIFLGLNTPSSAALIVFFIWIVRAHSNIMSRDTAILVLEGLIACVSFSMVMPVKYISSKSLKLKFNRVTVGLGVVLLALSAAYAPFSIYAYILAYALSGPLLALYWFAVRALRRLSAK